MRRGTGALLLGAALLACLVVAPVGAVAPGDARPAPVVRPIPVRDAARPAYVPTQPPPLGVPGRQPYPPTPLPAPTAAGPPTPTPTRYPMPRALPPPVLARRDVLARTSGAMMRVEARRVDRKEAKLLTLGEWEQARGAAAAADPTTPVWVVAVWGDFVIGGPFGAPTHHGDWAGTVFLAGTGGVLQQFAGPELASWAALPDRDPTRSPPHPEEIPPMETIPAPAPLTQLADPADQARD